MPLDTALPEPRTSSTVPEPRAWRTVRFDEMANSITDRVDKPSDAGVSYYVGLEHLDPESLKIRRWGTPDDVEATKLRFKPGDLIFGRRRAYQRKLAVAEFEGICSAHALVLRAREDVVLKDFLPFFMQGDIFYDRALQISVGSLSPTINWTALARQEFAVPPLDEQRRIAEILWAADGSIECAAHVCDSVVAAQSAMEESFICGGMPGWHAHHRATPIGSIPLEWECLPSAELVLEPPRNGLSPETNADGSGYPTLSIGAIRDGKVVTTGNVKHAIVTSSDAGRFRLGRGDVLIVRGNGNRNLVGRSGIVDVVPTDCFYPDLLIRMRFNPSRMLPRFANIQWNVRSVHERLLERAKSTNGIWKVNGQDLRQHLLAVPPILEQESFLAQEATFESARRQANAQLTVLKGVKSQIMRELLSRPRNGLVPYV